MSGIRRQKKGVVVSDKMQKTIVVRVESRVKHPRYSKVIKRYKNFKTHDEKNTSNEGDKVLIMETRPLSKDKRWRLVKVLQKAKRLRQEVEIKKPKTLGEKV